MSRTAYSRTRRAHRMAKFLKREGQMIKVMGKVRKCWGVPEGGLPREAADWCLCSPINLRATMMQCGIWEGLRDRYLEFLVSCT